MTRAPELTLEAALRDATSTNATARNLAIRNLAPALLAELWRGQDLRELTSDPRAVVAIETLHHAVTADSVVTNKALALVGLAQLADGAAVEIATRWLRQHEGVGEDDVFARECAVIALALSAENAGAGTQAAIIARIEPLLESEHPDVRFQAAAALADVDLAAYEARLSAALAAEPVAKVREQLALTFTELDQISNETARTLHNVVDHEHDAAVVFAASRTLAAHRDDKAIPGLMAALHVRDRRDDALEALAVLGPRIPATSREAIANIARSWWIAGVTRVRAAYALARTNERLFNDAHADDSNHGPAEGQKWLRRLARHPRRAVRDAVRDAHQALATLADRDDRRAIPGDDRRP